MSHTCKNCGRDYNGNFCPECGTPADGYSNDPPIHQRPVPPVNTHSRARSCSLGCALFLSIVLGIFIIVGVITRPSDPDTSTSNLSAVSQTNASSPTPTPFVVSAPVKYSGSGDDVITIDPLPEGYVFAISGNSASRHFAVTAYDAEGNQLDLLVNTTDPYSGITADRHQNAATLEIKAHGNWVVEMRSIYTLPVMFPGETYSGSGDFILVAANPGSTAMITGNPDSHHFAVIGVGHGVYDLLVNTTDVYSGTVKLNPNTSGFIVTAVGDWTITLN